MKVICIGRRIGLEDYLDYKMETEKKECKRKWIGALEIYEALVEFYHNNWYFPSARRLWRMFDICGVAVLKHFKTIEEKGWAKRTRNFYGCNPSTWEFYKDNDKYEREATLNKRVKFLENTNTRLVERVKDLEEMLGCLMKKNWMLKIYKGTKLIYQVK